jgi:hypothetical protein
MIGWIATYAAVMVALSALFGINWVAFVAIALLVIGYALTERDERR